MPVLRYRSFLRRLTASIVACWAIIALCPTIIGGPAISAEARAAPQTEIKVLPGHARHSLVRSPLPHEYIDADALPRSFSWANVNGTSYLTKSLNQHIPQYCGSCWAHGAMSALADRIKIARGGSGIDINLSIQFILNCGTEVAGSCHGGSASGAYQFVHDYGSIPYDTCQPYLACSSDSDWGFCANADTSCNPSNVCKTCTMKLVPSLHPFDQICREIDHYPNTTIAEYGTIRLQDEQSAEYVMDKVKAELFARGPVAAEVNGKELHAYQGGVYVNETASQKTTHVVAIVGWGELEDGRSFWVCRNSWGQAWGEMGYFRVLAGANVLGIEHSITWATPGVFSTSNFPCNEGGENCGPSHHHYLDPSVDSTVLQERLSLYR